ncbi:MAG: hypothetical protein GX136_08125, partial [Clostridiales bacterium]|nr:hypothetical protein [Clostridiales bacterium]
LITPATAIKENDYFCPSCGDKLIFRKGQVKVPHFAHGASNICNQETITHKTAKILIQKAITDWKASKTGPVTTLRECRICREIFEQKLPEKVENAALEVRLQNGFIVDVALMVEGKPQAAIEVKVSHEVEEAKANSLAVPFVELDGNDTRVRENIYIFKT